jgi:CRISPR system Cascade subunit CasE
VRVRPVVRSTDGRDRDAFLHAIDPNGEGSGTAPELDQGALLERTAIYSEWLDKQLSRNGAARVSQVRVEAFRLTRVVRRERSAEDGKRKTSKTTGPDVTFKGLLQVDDGEAFASLLARGVGRHRAFGFGMLLLRPAAQC